MKNLLTFALLILPFLLSAQISEESRSMIKGVKNALILELPESDDRMVKKWWTGFMKDHSAKPKRVKGSDEVLSAGASISGIGAPDVYAKADQVGSGVYMTVWFEQGEDNFLSSAADATGYTEAEKFLMRFALYVMREKVKIELNEEEKEFKQLNNELAKLERDNASYHREIEQAQERIRRAEANIVTNLENQEKTKSDISNQQEVVDEVKRRLSEL